MESPDAGADPHPLPSGGGGVDPPPPRPSGWLAGLVSGAGGLLASVLGPDPSSPTGSGSGSTASASSSPTSLRHPRARGEGHSGTDLDDSMRFQLKNYELNQSHKEPDLKGYMKASVATISDIEPKDAIMQLLMQETYSRSEATKLIKIVQERVVDPDLDGAIDGDIALPISSKANRQPTLGYSSFSANASPPSESSFPMHGHGFDNSAAAHASQRLFNRNADSSRTALKRNYSVLGTPEDDRRVRSKIDTNPIHTTKFKQVDDFQDPPAGGDHKAKPCSLEANIVDASEKVRSLEMQNRKLIDELKKVRNEHNNLHSSSVELHSQLTKAAEEKDHIRGFLKDKEGDNKALHQVVTRLQTICNEQEKTIAGLRQGLSAESDKESAGCCNGRESKILMELVRLTRVEQKLRSMVQSHRLEVESLRQENIALLNRIQSTENGSSFSSIRLGQELQARVDHLQIQGLSLLDKTSQLCTKLLDLVKCRRHENEHDRDIDALDYTLEFQSIKGGIDNLKKSLRATNAVLTEKQNLKKQSGEAAAEGSSPREQKDELYLVDLELKLKEKALLNRVLKEVLLSKELDIEQLQSDVASSLRIQYVSRNEIQRMQDELSCVTHKAKHMELQVSRKDESISQMQQDFQESAKELSALRGQLKLVTSERNLSWQEAKQLQMRTSMMQNEIASLKNTIESLEEENLIKGGEISILRDNSSKRPFDLICSPATMKMYGLE